MFGVYVWLGGTLRASDRGRSALPTCIRKPQTPKPSCLPACCLLPVIIMDWTVSIHLCRQVRQSALYKQVSRPTHHPPQGRPTPLPLACIFYALGGEWYEPADEAKLRGHVQKQAHTRIIVQPNDKSSYIPG